MGEKAGAVTVDSHFAGKPPHVRKVYERLLELLEKIGPVSEEPKKTSIHIVRESALAGVEVRREYLLLNLKTDYPIDSPRVERAERLSAEPVPHEGEALGDRGSGWGSAAVAQGRVLAVRLSSC